MFLFSLAKFLFWLSITFQQRRQWNPLQYSCLEKPMDRGAWWAAVHGVAKSWTRLSDFTFTFHFHALEKEMATHSSVIAWRTPGTGEPDGLPSMGSHRVRHDWSSLAAANFYRQHPFTIIGFEDEGEITSERGTQEKSIGFLVSQCLVRVQKRPGK